MPLFSRGTENADDRVKQAVKRLIIQNADLRHKQFLISSEQFAGPWNKAAQRSTLGAPRG